MRNKKYSSKKNFVNRRALQFLPFYYYGWHCKKQAFECGRDFRRGKINFSIFRKTKVVSNNFRLGPIHGNSLKEVSFLDRSAPVCS